MTSDASPATSPDTPASHTGRRLLGIAVDWILCLLVSSAFFPDPARAEAVATLPERLLLTAAPFSTLAIWAAQHLLLVATLGTTIGHRLVGVRVVRVDGVGIVGPLKALIRTVLLALVIPAVVWGPDGRGLHDRLAGTRIVRTGARP